MLIIFIAQVSFNLSSNASESSSSNLMTNDFENSQILTSFQPTFNHTVPNDLSKSKPVLTIKSASSTGLPLSLDVHKSSSLCSFDPQKQQQHSTNKNITRHETMKNLNLETLILVVHGGK